MSRRPLAAALVLAAAAGLFSPPEASSADAPPPDIVGIWSGPGPVVLSVDRQVGTAFDARLLADGRERPIYGVVQRDGREIMFINPEGNRRGELVAADSLSFCLPPRPDFRFVGPCVTLGRAPHPAE